MPKELFKIGFDAPRMSADKQEAEILLYGEIINDGPDWSKWSKEDKGAAEFDKIIRQVKNDGASKLLLRLNSPGGFVRQAVAMRSTLVQAKFDSVNIRIEGLCASAATIIATLPGAHVSITPGSEYMIHNPHKIVIGEAKDFEHAAENLRQTEATAREFYALKTGKDEAQIKEWMDNETWFTAKQAVENGFCDELLSETGDEEELFPIAACAGKREFAAMRALYRNMPDTIRERAEKTVRISEPSASGEEPEHINPITPNKDKEEETMEITMELIEREHHEVFEQIMNAGAERERERMNDIDDLTPAGYEEMAKTAKADGTDAMTYHKMLVKAQREKKDAYLEARTKETEPANKVRGMSSEDNVMSDDDEIKAHAKEMAKLAEQMYSGNGAAGMY